MRILSPVIEIEAAVVASPLGVFDLDAKLLKTIDGLDRPNYIDVEYGLPRTANLLPSPS